MINLIFAVFLVLQMHSKIIPNNNLNNFLKFQALRDFGFEPNI